MDRLPRFAWGVLGYNVLVVLWGAVVRATGSGAGCGSHWPLCNGEVVPRTEAVATLIEFSHRATSGLALLLVLGLVIRVFRARPAGHPARAAAAGSMAFMAGEAAVGAMLVLFELVADNRSLARGLFMATHLLNTFLLLGALTLTARFLGGAPSLRLHGRGRDASLLGLGIVAVLVTSASGAVAALGDTLFPSQTLSEALRADWSAASHLLIRLRVLHPFLAVATGSLLLWLSLWPRPGHSRSPARSAPALAALTVSQAAVGALNVLLLAPLWLQLVHLLLADLVWIALVLLAVDRLGSVRSEEKASAPASAAAVPFAAP
jgi:heme A synthase